MYSDKWLGEKQAAESIVFEASSEVETIGVFASLRVTHANERRHELSKVARGQDVRERGGNALAVQLVKDADLLNHCVRLVEEIDAALHLQV